MATHGEDTMDTAPQKDTTGTTGTSSVRDAHSASGADCGTGVYRNFEGPPVILFEDTNRIIKDVREDCKITTSPDPATKRKIKILNPRDRDLDSNFSTEQTQHLGPVHTSRTTKTKRSRRRKRKRRRHGESRDRGQSRGRGRGRGRYMLAMSNYCWVEGFQQRLERAKQEAEETHPFPRDTHLLQNLSPVVVKGPFDLEARLLNHDKAQTKPYYSRKKRGELITVNHWGQRKLLMSEIEFLTRCVSQGKSYTVVYAGAAPGSHINFLAELYPQCSFVLIDPAPFLAYKSNRVTIIREYMRREVAIALKCCSNILFISDIRTGCPRVMNPSEVENRIKVDNEMQSEWIEIMNPLASLLKFRCPYYDEEEHKLQLQRTPKGDKDTYLYYNYYKGDIYLPVWGGQSTTECRLFVPHRRERTDYNTKRYQNQCFYFNTETRVSYYPHSIESPGLCHCFDCRSEVKILTDYVRKFNVGWNSTERRVEGMVDGVEIKISIPEEMKSGCSFGTSGVDARIIGQDNPQGSEADGLKDARCDPSKNATPVDTIVQAIIPAVSKYIQTSSTGRTLEFIEPTRSSYVAESDYAVESAYLRKLVENAPDIEVRSPR
ncbi:hypothetical protein AAMO2058_000422300 [Amorphochlora amoebiformis]